MMKILLRPLCTHKPSHLMMKCLMSRKTESDVTSSHASQATSALILSGREFEKDLHTNISENIIKHMSRKLHQQKNNPLYLIKQRIVNYFYKNYVGSTGNPIFSVYDNIDPIVTTYQNFDSLRVPLNHSSRRKSDSYYLNSRNMLRAHMTAHQSELISSGLDNFLVVGDVYRRDAVDRTHSPVFHQCDGVRLQTNNELFPEDCELHVFEKQPSKRTYNKQAEHTDDAVRILTFQMRSTLLNLAKVLCGNDVDYRWVDAYFPFTHPSWELEIQHEGQWLELLGCGIIEHSIVDEAGAGDRIGWAFGLGLDRIAMRVYDIPDIRLLWSTDPSFSRQFEVDNPDTPIKYKPVSIFPSCIKDVSFWLPILGDFSENDFFEIVRSLGGDIIEEVFLLDKYQNLQGVTSHCYRIKYRHMERTLTNEEINILHSKIREEAATKLSVQLRLS